MQDDSEDTILAASRPAPSTVGGMPAGRFRPGGAAAGEGGDGGDEDDTVIVERARPRGAPGGLPPELVEPALSPRGAALTDAPTPDKPPTDTSFTGTPHPDTPGPTSGAAAPTDPPGTAPGAAAATYRFRIGDTVVALDKRAFIGRRPARPRVSSDALPRLIHVPSPLHEVSATHLEIRQRGASVVVTDLRSTNGSVVNIPGSPPRNLRQGESMVVTPGTLVDIGDGILVEILPMHHAQGSEDPRTQAGRHP